MPPLGNVRLRCRHGAAGRTPRAGSRCSSEQSAPSLTASARRCRFPTMFSPKLFVIAGPNGAGKSTCAAAILPRRFPTERFLNADNIARALATDSPIEAGRVMIRRMCKLRACRETFAFETTFSGRTYIKFLREAQNAGYRLHLAYIWLSNVEVAKKRVSVRVQRGGHDVPAADIERRYWRGLSNLFQLYLPLADRWTLCDNSGGSLVPVARGRVGKAPTIYDQARFDRIRDAAGRD